jgi:exodeoxyribonuclease VII large subunit
LSTENSILTLSTLARHISNVVKETFGTARFWVVAEVIGLKVSRGHCYLQLAEKDEFTVTPKAEFRAIIWANNFEHLHERFQKETGGVLREQLQILCCVEVQFHERYGLSLIVHDLDPSYTLGQLELQRRKTVERLKQEGIYSLNKNRVLPDVIQRIAVISAEDSRGYEDFIKRLTENPYGYKFEVKLYPSLLQGDMAAGAIISKLIAIYDHLTVQPFDAVLIVRGGGGASSLACFDDYQLARAVARFPLPVLTGIGHTANQSVVDEVANTSVITPTDAAVFLVNHMAAFESDIVMLWQQMESLLSDRLDEEREFIKDAGNLLAVNTRHALAGEKQSVEAIIIQCRYLASQFIVAEKQNINVSAGALSTSVKYIADRQLQELNYSVQSLIRIAKEKPRSTGELLNTMESRIRLLDPVNVLKRGYSYTLKDNRIVNDVSGLKEGDLIKTILANGEINSNITKINHG